jgi:endogenous inhibitor of DNA gyrase (YacG/DUF329 family)
MSRIMITCPETGKPIYTGMNFDWPAIEPCVVQQGSLTCPRCGHVHEWCDKELFPEEDGGEA